METNGRACRLCGVASVVPLLDLGRMPIAHRLVVRPADPEDTFPFVLSVCGRCGLLQVADPIDPEMLYRDFNYNFSSWKPEPHRADELALLLDRVRPGSVAEIGANDGLFLEELRAAGVARLAGIEPNPVSGARARERGLAVVEAMATAAVAEQLVGDGGRFDAVVSRQVLEHVPDVATFFAAARALVRDDGYLFIDVPDMAPAAALGDCSVLWEEHATYYTQPTLEALLRANGFEPVAVRTYDFSGGCLAVLARRVAHRAAVDLADPAGVARADVFAERVGAYATRLKAALAAARARGVEVAIYGAGVRACTLTNALRLDDVCWSIDDQPERVGKFLPGTHAPIRPRAALAESDDPIVVLLAVNNENEARVRARIAETTSRPAGVFSVCGPADIWRELDALEAFVAPCAV